MQGLSARNRSILLKSFTLGSVCLALVCVHQTLQAAGIRYYSNIPISAMPADVRAGQGNLLEIGYVDITKAPYNADPTGVRDSTAAIDRAMDDGYRNAFVVYVPKGTYLVSRPMRFDKIHDFKTSYNSDRKFGNQMVGDTSGGTFPVFKVKDGSLGSGDTLLTFWFTGCVGWQSACQYMSHIRGIEIDMGNNPGANALSMACAQWCTIEDVYIHGDNFRAGIKDLPGSGGSATNVRVVGGDIGILQDEYRPTPSVQNVELINQKLHGLEMRDVRGSVIFAGFKIQSNAPNYSGIYSGISAARDRIRISNNVVLVDGSIETTGQGSSAIDMKESSVYMRNAYVKSPVIMRNGQGTSPTEEVPGKGGWQYVKELAFADGNVGALMNINGDTKGNHKTDRVHTQGIVDSSGPPSGLAAIHGWNPAQLPSYFAGNVLNVKDFGATPDQNGDDDAPKINAALQAGVQQNKAVFMPRGWYYISSPIEIPVGAKLIGSSFTHTVIQSATGWRPGSQTAMVRTQDAQGSIFLSDFAINGREPWTGQLDAHQNIVLFHGRTSNMFLRTVHINRWEDYNRRSTFKEPPALFTGNAGGRVYNLGLDLWHGPASTAGSYRMILIDGTRNPLAIYQPDTEGADVHPQTEIRNAQNVSWYGFKYERKNGAEGMLEIKNSNNIAVFGGSGNYWTRDGIRPLLTVTNSNNVVLTNFQQQNDDEGPTTERFNASWVSVDGQSTVPVDARYLSLYKKGDIQGYGELVGPQGNTTTTGGTNTTNTTGTQTTTTNTTGTNNTTNTTNTTGTQTTGTQTNTSTNTTGAPSACHVLNPGASVAQGFGAPWNVFTNQLLMSVTCDSQSATLVIAGTQLNYIYTQAHLWNGTTWQQFTLSGAQTVGDVWIPGNASGQIPQTTLQQNFVVSYICTWIPSGGSGSWKCGCRDQACATPMWQLQAFSK